MKKTKRFLAVVLCMLLMLTPLAVVAETVTVQAAGPQTVKVKLDKKTGKRYGYDENNQKVTQQWGVTAKGFRYYFGKNGAAYQADQDMVGKYGILMKKINGKYYGFDVSGHTVKGIRVGSVSMYEIPKLYYFNPKRRRLYIENMRQHLLWQNRTMRQRLRRFWENIKSVQ